MYTSVTNQLYNLLHYVFSFGLMYIIWPRFLFSQKNGNGLEQTMANYIKMVFFTIIFGYLLVLTKLFEVISIVVILFLFTFRSYLGKRAITKREGLYFKVSLYFYDFLDGQIPFRKLGFEWYRKRRESSREYLKKRRVRDLVYSPKLLVAIILMVSAYIRFADVFQHAAPPLSDSYVTLAWMKYINRRILFHDGIYPQGFHIYLAVLSKFASIDPLYILRYSGPLNSLFIVFGLFYIVYKITGSMLGGCMSAILYGILGGAIMGGDWDRQAATNSQEFAMVFVFPTLYFFHKYLRTNQREVFWIAAAGLAITGLVHSLIFAFLGLAIGAMYVAMLLHRRAKWTAVKQLILVAAGSGVLSILPLGLGMLLGDHVHSASEEYLTAKVSGFYLPTLHGWDYAGCFSILVLFIAALRKKHPDITFLSLLGGSIFFLYYLGGGITHNEVIASRSQTLWAMVLPVCVGTAVILVIKNRRWQHLLLVFMLLISCYQLQPIEPYKMQWDASVEQYLRINESMTPKSWMIISSEEQSYALVLGNGYHMYTNDFLAAYDPTKEPLTRKGQDKPDRNLPPDIYIFLQKHIFEVSKSNSIYSIMEPIYKDRERALKGLDQWFAAYKLANQSLDVFYEDNNLKVIHIHQNLPDSEDADQGS